MSKQLIYLYSCCFDCQVRDFCLNDEEVKCRPQLASCNVRYCCNIGLGDVAMPKKSITT